MGYREHLVNLFPVMVIRVRMMIIGVGGIVVDVLMGQVGSMVMVMTRFDLGQLHSFTISEQYFGTLVRFSWCSSLCWKLDKLSRDGRVHQDNGQDGENAENLLTCMKFDYF